MQYLIITVVSFCLLSCKNDKAAQKKSLKDSVAVSQADTVRPVTSAMPVEPIRNFPAGFHLDSFRTVDKELNFTIDMYYPVAEDHGYFNMLLKNIMDDEEAMYRPYFADKDGGESDFTLWVSDFSINKNIVGVCLTDQGYTAGAAHYNHGYRALSFHMAGSMRFLFTDLFDVYGDKKKQAFCDAVNDCCRDRNESLSPSYINTETDFLLVKDKIYLYFDDGERGPGMSRLEIPLSSVKKFLSDWGAKQCGLRK